MNLAYDSVNRRSYVIFCLLLAFLLVKAQLNFNYSYLIA